jgi:fatty acid desaturase
MKMSEESDHSALERTNGTVCIPNINRWERQKRLAFGGVMLLVSLGVLAILLAIGASRWWRLVLYPLFAGAGTGFFQWRDKT